MHQLFEVQRHAVTDHVVDGWAMTSLLPVVGQTPSCPAPPQKDVDAILSILSSGERVSITAILAGLLSGATGNTLEQWSRLDPLIGFVVLAGRLRGRWAPFDALPLPEVDHLVVGDPSPMQSAAYSTLDALLREQGRDVHALHAVMATTEGRPRELKLSAGAAVLGSLLFPDARVTHLICRGCTSGHFNGDVESELFAMMLLAHSGASPDLIREMDASLGERADDEYEPLPPLVVPRRPKMRWPYPPELETM